MHTTSEFVISIKVFTMEYFYFDKIMVLIVFLKKIKLIQIFVDWPNLMRHALKAQVLTSIYSSMFSVQQSIIED